MNKYRILFADGSSPIEVFSNDEYNARFQAQNLRQGVLIIHCYKII